MAEQTLKPRMLMNRELRSMLLLISIVLFFVLAPLLEDRKVGGLMLILTLYATLVAATSKLAEQKILLWTAIPIASSSMILLLASHIWPNRPLLVSSSLVLTIFLLLVSVSLFAYLGKRGKISTDRLLVSVSLYFLIGLTWFSLYNLINLLEPGSFAEAGVPLTDKPHWSTMLYFSLVTLTTVGYGDVLAIKPSARIFATLEAAAGVLYVAITVARLVALQSPSSEDAS